MKQIDLSFLNSFGLGHWTIQVFVVVFLSLCVDFILKLVLNRAHRRLVKTRTFWDNIVIEAVKAPLSLVIWVIGISFAAQIIEVETKAPIFEAIDPLRDIGIIIGFTWFLLRLIKLAEKNLLTHRLERGQEVDKTTLDAISKILRATVFITASLVVMQNLGFSVSGVLAFGGIGGIAIGFAAKDMLANFFGAFMIYWDRPFKVGDWVCSPDKQIEGFVEQIGWRLTRIRKFDKRPIYVPNAIFTTITVENPSRMSHRQIKETIGIRYCDAGKLPDILSEVRALLRTHPEIDQKQTLNVNFTSYGQSSLDFFIYAFTLTTDWVGFHRVKEEILLKINDIIENAGAEIAFPTSTIYLANQQEPEHSALVS